jgi:SAM-dependent methyltransferase
VAGGLSEAPEVATVSYDPAFFARLFAIEDRHFWFRTRNRAIAAAVHQVIASFPSGYGVLEVGCGTGIVLRLLEQVCRDGVVIGMDPFPEALEFARQRTSCALVQGDAHAPPFVDPFHLIGLFDVLEHLCDDVDVLHTLRTMLVPGGALVLTVPAQMSVWSYFDEASHHCRRYSRETLATVLRAAGFDVEYVSHFMTVLLPLLWTARRVGGRLRRPESRSSADTDELAMRELTVVPGINAALAWGLGLESLAVARRWRLPIGASLIAVARAPHDTQTPASSTTVIAGVRT